LERDAVGEPEAEELRDAEGVNDHVALDEGVAPIERDGVGE